MRKLLSLLMMLTLVTSLGLAEVPLLKHAAEWDLTDTPVSLTLSADVRTHMPFDESRMGMLQTVLNPLSLRLYAHGDQQAVTVLVGRAEALTLAKNGEMAQLSCQPEVTYRSASDPMGMLLGADLTSNAALALEGKYEQWLEDGWTLLNAMDSEFKAESNRKSVKTNIEEMGTARSCTDYTITKKNAKELLERLLPLCPEGELRDLLASLTFSGEQKLRVYRTAEEVPLRMEYNGSCAVGDGTARTTKLVWRMKRTNADIRDEITLTHKGVKLEFERETTVGARKVEVEGSLLWQTTVNNQKAYVDLEYNLTNTFGQDQDVIRGEIEIETLGRGEEKEVETIIRPEIILAGTQENPNVSGSIAWKETRSRQVTEDCTVYFSLERADAFPWTEGGVIRDLDAMDTDTLLAVRQQAMKEAASALVKPLVQMLGKNASYFFQDLPEETVQMLIDAVNAVVIEAE